MENEIFFVNFFWIFFITNKYENSLNILFHKMDNTNRVQIPFSISEQQKKKIGDRYS